MISGKIFFLISFLLRNISIEKVSRCALVTYRISNTYDLIDIQIASCVANVVYVGLFVNISACK